MFVLAVQSVDLKRALAWSIKQLWSKSVGSVILTGYENYVTQVIYVAVPQKPSQTPQGLTLNTADEEHVADAQRLTFVHFKTSLKNTLILFSFSS